MEEYTFVARDFNIKLYIRIHNFISGFFARKDTLKDFCASNAIDYKPKKDRKYKMPENYLIRHGELKYLGGIRDKVILGYYGQYKKIQDENHQECQRLQTEIEKQKDIIEDDKAKLTNRKKQLSVAKDSLEKINLQDDIGGLDTSIANEKTVLTELKTKLDKHKNIMSANIVNWGKQVDIINNNFVIRKDNFTRNIGRKIAKELNFTRFIAEFPDYNDSVKAILGGRYNEK